MRRRLIRSFFLGLLLMCVGAWVAGRWYWAWTGYAHANFCVLCRSGSGVLRYEGRWGWHYGLKEGWQGDTGANRPIASPWGPRVLGSGGFGPSGPLSSSSGWFRPFSFGWFSYPYIPGSQYVIVDVPYWFLTALCALAIFFVWRKTGKPKPGGAFPVELAAKGET